MGVLPQRRQRRITSFLLFLAHSCSLPIKAQLYSYPIGAPPRRRSTTSAINASGASSSRFSSNIEGSLLSGLLSSNSRLIAIVIHGQAFRDGNQFTKKTAKSPRNQLRAVNSIRQHLILPLFELDWILEVFVDAVVTDAALFEEYSSLLRTSWGHRVVSPGNVRVRPNNLRTQLLGIMDSLNWANTTSPGILNRASYTILCRIDLILKPDLNLPVQPQEGMVTVLGYLPDSKEVARIVDVFFWIPRQLVAAFIKLKYGSHELHNIHKTLPCAVMYMTPSPRLALPACFPRQFYCPHPPPRLTPIAPTTAQSY